MNKKALYPLLVLTAGFGLAYLIATNEVSLQPEPYEPIVATVRVTPVVTVNEHLRITSQGTVQPRTQSELIPEVSGRVVWMSPALVDGGRFQREEILARIDDADYVTALQRTKAVLQRTKVEFEYAADELKRLRSLHKRELASQKQLDNARRAEQVASANLGESRAALEQAERDLARTEIKAPYDGLVRNEQVDIGQFIARGTSIGTIYATDYVEVRLPIAADQLIYTGLPVATSGHIPDAIQPTVLVSGLLGGINLQWEGRLVRLDAEIDERSRMIYGVVRLRQDVDETHPIIPVGLFVQADIRGRKVENIVRLPRSAMRDQNQVLVVDEENRLRFRQVSIMRLEHDDMIIDGGLENGELVCLSPLQTVVDGMLVKPVIEREQ